MKKVEEILKGIEVNKGKVKGNLWDLLTLPKNENLVEWMFGVGFKFDGKQTIDTFLVQVVEEVEPKIVEMKNEYVKLSKEEKDMGIKFFMLNPKPERTSAGIREEVKEILKELIGNEKLETVYWHTALVQIEQAEKAQERLTRLNK